MSHFLISCGGTGGHLSPGIALAEGLLARGHSPTLLISQKKVDARLLEKYPHLNAVPVASAPLTRSPSGFFRFLAAQARGFSQCRHRIRTQRPAVIIGFGGFTTAPAALAGRMAGVPVALHEANRVPGRAVRSLARFARRVYLPPDVTLPGLRREVVRHAGLPVRAEIERLPREDARRRLGLEPDAKTLVIFGGSQGATALNNWARTELTALAAEGVQLYVVTGHGHGEPSTQNLTTLAGRPIVSIFSPFCDQVAALLSAADLVVARAGAGTLAEFIRCETPSILVPYPHAADDHQRANAAYFADQGGGLVLSQDQLGGLSREVRSLLFDAPRLGTFRANLRRLNQFPVLDLLLDDLEELGGIPNETSARREVSA
jgi:UDP-N-acetylglucosamine--N-acetylmuramyl-(pentapeptide) pyrophosphoryl-undecaprenol N-acetylglucosamine transferase